jgi:DNA replication and repair protein RecF
VHLAHLRLRDFRNYGRLDADFSPGFHLLLGHNAQGKTNILEAIYLLATLRSFRGVGGAQMIRHEAKGYFVGASVVSHAAHDIKMYWSLAERKLSLDGQPVKRLTDYLGTLRAVVFCTEDLQLVKGTARSRRRFLDLLLAQTQPSYLPLLQRYAHALRSRNSLLKQRAPDPALLDSFSQELVTLGTQLTAARRELLPRISPLARLAYRRIAHDAEELRLDYQPSVKADFAVELARVRDRERAYRATLVGPHRDDLALLLNERPAAQFGSEGQKRTLAVALKMAQAEYLTGLLGAPPVLLIDDVMGELDAKRRAGLLPLLERAHHARGQVFMTCTEENWPRELGRKLNRWEITAGALAAKTEA